MRAFTHCALALLFLLALACERPAQPPNAGSAAGAAHATSAQATSAGTASCPARAPAPEHAPGVRPEHLTLEYWLARHADIDAPVLSAEDIAHYDAALGRRPGDHPASQRDVLEPVDSRLLRRELAERLRFVGDRVRDQRFVGEDGSALPAEALGAFDARLPDAPIAAALHVALAPIPLRCGPYDGALLEPGSPRAYDRNACSTVREQEPISVLARWPNGMLLAQTRYARGFIAASALLSPEIAAPQRESVVHGARGVLATGANATNARGALPALPPGTTLPLAQDGSALVATTRGVELVHFEPAPTQTRRALTRRALLTEAFSYLGGPYGLGDTNGGRDCSRMLLDLFERFDVALPRHSGWQAQAGSYTIDVSQASEAEKRARVDAASREGIVLLALPGHIMLDLGAREDGEHMVLHALGEYVRPCDGGGGGGGGGETVLDVQRVTISDLSLGRGSSRRSLLERITSLIVFGPPPSTALASTVRMAPAPPPTAPAESASCTDDVDHRIFVSPRRPIAGKPVRFIATATNASERSELWLFDESGRAQRAPLHRLGGPPFTVWAELPSAAAGRYAALWTDGAQTLGCKRIHVREPQRDVETPSASVWEPRFRWERDTNNLWAAFIEQLFDDPPDDDRTWTSLHDVLRDRSRNLLYGHLGVDEDAGLELVPDCADLPFSLRAYFAWKLRLPFAFRRCSRGRTGTPPTCGELHGNVVPREAPDELGAFSFFVNRNVRSGVHSASGRTAPNDEATDLYPVALERSALTPGTVYADPYGHVMMLTQWLPQGRAGQERYGVLMAAEAQPDNTVGRRRFSRGSFLFDPSTKDVGAGFKHFRPIVYDRPSRTLSALDNATLATTDEHGRFSLEQYEGSLEDFYDRVDRLINPQPLDPSQRLASLLDGFREAVERRVLSIELGQQYVAAHPGARVIPMPVGHEVFETTGPWEDFSTPSRDLRLLIALDELLGLPARVAAHPERFGLPDAASAQTRSRALQTELDTELQRRRFAYTRSDGELQELSFAALVQRAPALEVAYNPNDCPEVRWGAPAGSDELATCKRHAPAEQVTRMERYRAWFHSRTRPARGAREP